MKYVILLLFIFSCQVQQKPQTKVMEKRRPIQNDAIINRMQAQTAEETLERLNMIEKTTPASAKSLIKPQVSDFPLQEPPRIERKEILEISGSQNRPSVSNAVNPSTFAPPKNESNFVISTSPAYIGVELEEVRKILEKFGNVKIIKIGDFFSLKVYPNAGLKTEGEAREFMQNIIKSSFFDVYVEKTPY